MATTNKTLTLEKINVRGGPVFFTSTQAGFDGDPNLAGATAVLKNAPVGTRYLRDTPLQEYVKLTAGATGWVEIAGIVTPGGSDTQVQYNNVSAFGGMVGVTWNNVTNTLVLASTATLTPLGTATDTIRVGRGALASALDAIAIGADASAITASAVALGADSTADGSGQCTATGKTADAGGTSSSAYGGNSRAVGSQSVSIGQNSSATNSNTTAVGRSSSASGLSSTALGFNAIASQTNTVAAGNTAQATASGASAIGNVAVAGGTESIAIGSGASVGAVSHSSISIGSQSSVATSVLNAISVGQASAVTHEGAGAWGRDAASTGVKRLTIGTIAGSRDMELQIGKGFAAWGSAPPATQPTVTGSRGGNAALASFLTAIAATGLIIDGSTA